MSLRRQLRGLLQVITPAGVHYVSPSFAERIYLIWLFRNFRMLPSTVLSKAERRRIQSMVTKYRRASAPQCDEILGSVELVGELRKPVRATVVPLQELAAKSRGA